jgi:CelD/BcsL family acetyltransferase involved in cellulose biosynthesis
VRYLREPDVDVLVAAAEGTGGVDLRVHQRSPYIEIDRPWDEYTKRLDKRWLRQLEKRRGRLDAQGGLTLDVVDGTDGDLDALLAEGFRIESLGWKGEAGTAVLSKPDTAAFYTALAKWSAERGWLRLAFLRVGDQAVAFDLSLEADGVHWFVKTGFDPVWREQAPGLILRHDMVKRAFDLGLRRYELMGSDESWKATWTDEVHEQVQAIVVPGRRVGPVATAAWHRALPAAMQARTRLREWQEARKPDAG